MAAPAAAYCGKPGGSGTDEAENDAEGRPAAFTLCANPTLAGALFTLCAYPALADAAGPLETIAEAAEAAL